MEMTKKQLGIWMDHTIARLIQIKEDSITTNSIESTFLQSEKQNFGQDESLKNNTEQNQNSEFYKRLSDVIMEYSEVLLFGPTNAKTELYNLIKENRQFNTITIEVETTDNLTENQMQAFVKEHFEKKG
jgi:hypothetical protein